MYTFTYVGPTKIELRVRGEHRMLFWALDAICITESGGYWSFDRHLKGTVENLCAHAGLKRSVGDNWYEQETYQETEAG